MFTAARPYIPFPNVPTHSGINPLTLVMVATLIAVAFAIGASSQAFATTAVGTAWYEFPIYRGTMTTIAEAPGDANIFYVGTEHAGIFKTTNAGSTWSPSRAGLTNFKITSIAVDPLNSAKLLAGSEDDGIWRSINGGATWTPTSGIELDFLVTNIVYDPIVTNNAFAATSRYSEGNIYCSTDGGANWIVCKHGMPGSGGSYTDSIPSLAIDASNPDVLYAGTRRFGTYRSIDGSINWFPVGTGLPNDGPSDYGEVSAIAVSSHDQHAWALVDDKFDDKLYELDETETWIEISDAFGLVGEHLDIMPDDANIMFVSGGFPGDLKKSIDGGVSWNTSLGSFGSPETDEVAEIAFNASAPNRILAAGSPGRTTEIGGVFGSTDRGVTWDLATQGTTAAALMSVAVDQLDPNHLLVGTSGGGLMYSQDGGWTWMQAHNALDLDDHSFGFWGITDIVVDPANGQCVFFAANSLWASNDGGVSFGEIVDADYAQVLAVAPGATTTIYVGQSFGGGIVRGSVSPVCSSSWEPANNGFPICTSGPCDATALTVDPGNSLTVWAGTSGRGGIVKTTDGGDNWVQMGLTTTYKITAVAVSPGSSSLILAGTDDGEIYKSSNGGSTWSLKYQGVDDAINSIQFNSTLTIHL